MAWERLGFKSIVIIVGARCEWENDPTLTVILSHLQNRGVSVIFINVPEEYRSILSKTARLFVTNLEGFPGKKPKTKCQSGGSALYQLFTFR